MARSWLEVTTDEVQSKLGAGERLAERRAEIAEQAQRAVADVASPVFKQAAEANDWVYLEEHGTEWCAVRCGVHGPGDVERDPTVAFKIAEFDAYQPLVVLRAKGPGAAARPTSQVIHLDKLDRDTLERFLDAD